MSALVGADGGPLPSAAEDAAPHGARASAFPVVHDSTRPPAAMQTPADVSALGNRTAALGLHETQAWFAAVITDPQSVDAGLRAAHALLGAAGALPLTHILSDGPHQSAAARLGIYHHAYHARLVECLADDYPAVAHLLGAAGFAALARRYIAAHPSRSPNLNGFGAHFAAFIDGLGAAFPHAAFAAELATLEWALVEVLHAPVAPAVFLEGLRAVPEQQWEAVRFTKSPTLRFLRFAYPVNAYLQSVRIGTASTPPPKAPSATAVYRESWKIWRMDFTPSMALVLHALLEGASLGAALATLARVEGSQRASEGDVMTWFRAWMSGGFFSAVEV